MGRGSVCEAKRNTSEQITLLLRKQTFGFRIFGFSFMLNNSIRDPIYMYLFFYISYLK